MAISSWGGCGWPIYAVGATRCRLEIHPYDKYSWRKNHTIYPQNLSFSPTANPNSFPLPDPSISHSQNQTGEKILVFTLILLWILLISIFCVSFLNFWDWVLLCLLFFFLMCFPSSFFSLLLIFLWFDPFWRKLMWLKLSAMRWALRIVVVSWKGKWRKE